MRGEWLWDRKTTESSAKKILKKPESKDFYVFAALLLSRKNEPRDVFRNYLDPVIFCRRWAGIKRRMRQDKWTEPRIIFWQAVYEKLANDYRKKGMVFRREKPAKNQFYESVGKKIAVMRNALGLSQKGLAKKIGISQQVISRIEKGGENISLSSLARIAQALDKKVTIDFIG